MCCGQGCLHVKANVFLAVYYYCSLLKARVADAEAEALSKLVRTGT